MRLKIHKIEVTRADALAQGMFAGALRCVDYIWTLGSRNWKNVTCEKCLLHKPKRDRRQKELF